MGTWFCRWSNGDLALVTARTKSEAGWILDEEADPGGCEFHRLAEGAVFLRLLDSGQLVIGRFSDGVRDVLEDCYPLQNEYLEQFEDPDAAREDEEILREATRRERGRPLDEKRLLDNEDNWLYRQLKAEGCDPSSERGAAIAAHMGVSLRED